MRQRQIPDGGPNGFLFLGLSIAATAVAELAASSPAPTAIGVERILPAINTLATPLCRTAKYWYSSHPEMQQERALYGALLIKEPQESWTMTAGDSSSWEAR